MWRLPLFFFAAVGDEIELRALHTLELCGAFRAGKVIADAEGVTLQFVDRGQSLPIVRSFGAGNSHALGLAGGIERVSPLVRQASAGTLILAVVKFEADGLQDNFG